MEKRGAVILFGANGQVGTRLNTALEAAGYEVTALDRTACDFATIEPKQIELAIRAVDPVLVINAAAYTAVTPVAAALGGAVLLGEPLGALTMAATLVTGAGVLLSTGILSHRS